jgi:hypothetical protein
MGPHYRWIFRRCYRLLGPLQEGPALYERRFTPASLLKGKVRTTMEDFVRYVKRTLVQLAGLAFFVTACLVLVGKGQYVSGWLIGCGLNLLYFIMLCSRSVKALKLDPAKAAAVIRGGSALRILMIVLMFIVILQFPAINYWAALAGILTYRILIYAQAIYTALSHGKNK